MNNILVTGGLGFIGANFIRLLLESDEVERIVNLDLMTYAGNPENLADLEDDPRYFSVRGDIGEGELSRRLMFEHHIDAVVNFAAESHVDRSIDSPEPFFQTNVMGTLSLLDAARKHWSSLSDPDRSSFRFLHVSTDEVYGSLTLEDSPFCESTSYAPNSPYSASKAGADHLVRAYHHTYGFPTVTTNCSNNYGPYQFPEKLIPLMILNALDGKPLPIYGDGSNVRDWLFVRDHCEGIWAALSRGRVGETYCIGGNAERTNLQVLDCLCTALDELCPAGAPHARLKTFVKDRPGHDQRYAIDFSKIHDELGWSPNLGFEDGIRSTVEWYLANRSWCEAITSGKYQRERLGLS
ncbi:MAG: dTDP-glucose 4,6-dehydratase [Verrucomicrobia bacterium]|nr:dTDP-glucose 4,6-dehydratase [Verrucomicrobiota bacterium]